MSRGCFITFEGIEGAGKTTQIKKLRRRIEELGRKALVTREPGGPPLSEGIRELLLSPAYRNMDPVAELLLYLASRAQHVRETIAPAVAAGEVVLCDRFGESTIAYQGAGRGLEERVVRELHALASGGLTPDLTIVLDVRAEEGLQRARRRGARDRIELESIEFHERVRQGYLRLAQSEPERILVVDGEAEPDAIAGTIWRAASKRIAASGKPA